MASDKYYGIVMSKKEITEGVCIYFPDHLVEGEVYENDLEDKIFTDFYGEDYLFMTDPMNIFSPENVVGYVVSEQQLLEEYDNDLANAKIMYFDKVKETAHFGFYLYVLEKIAFVDLNMDNVHRYFNESVTEDIGNISLPATTLISLLLGKYEESYEVQEQSLFDEGIYFSIEEIKRLLKLSPDKVIESLNYYYENYNKLEQGEMDMIPFPEDIEKENILDRVYNHIFSIDNIDEMKETIKQIVEVYTGLICDLDEKIDDDKTREYVSSAFYQTVAIYDSLLNINDLQLIKDTIKKVKKRQEKHLKKTLDQLYPSKVLGDNIDNNQIEEKEELSDALEAFSVRGMKEYFDNKIIGQEQAKKDVISALFMNSVADETISKNTCLLVGPTGSGKTLIAESVAEYLDLPFVCIDTTQLTMPGYVGANIEDFLARLISSANGDVEKAQRGVVVLDEIDKKGSSSNGDVSGRGVLNTLLPFIQGTTYRISANRKTVDFDTSGLTIFATGAFTDVARDSKEGGYNGSNIGFGSSISNEGDEDIKYEKLKIEDLAKYGNIPIEFLGRISTITQLSGHTKESLKQILTDSNISVLQLEKKKLEKIGVELVWNDDYLDGIVDVAMKLKTGARSLKSSVDKSITDARWEVIYAPSEFSKILLNKECVDDPSLAVLVYQDGNYTTVKELYSNKTLEKEKVKEKINDKK